MVLECSETTLQIYAAVPMNILTKLKGLAKNEWLEAFKDRLMELKGISDALWNLLITKLEHFKRG